MTIKNIIFLKLFKIIESDSIKRAKYSTVNVLPFFIVFIMVSMLFSKLLLAGEVLFWGTPALQFIPWWYSAWNSLQQGYLPLWNLFNGMGSPLLANYQSGFLYFPNWLLFVFAKFGSAPGIAAGYTLLEFFHLVWAGWGMVFFLKKLNLSTFSQIIGSLAFSLSGYFIARSGFYSMIWAGSWLPWLMYAVEYELERCSIRLEEKLPIIWKISLPYVFVFCMTMQLLSGHAQLTWYSLMLSIFWMVSRCLGIQNKQVVLTIFINFVFGILLSVLLACVQLVPTLEYLMQSHRSSSLDIEEALTYSFWPWRLLTLFSPDFFGSPATGNYWGYGAFWEDAAYIGIIPVIAAVSTLKMIFSRSIMKGKRDRLQIVVVFFWVVSAISLLFALGKNTPLFPFLFKNIPSFNMFQAPSRYMIWFVFSFSVLAAVGIQNWRPPENKLLYWSRLGTMGAFAVTIGSFASQIVFDSIKITFVQGMAMMGFWLTGAGVLNLLLPSPQGSIRMRLWRIAVIFWIGADLIVSNWGLLPGVNPSIFSPEGITSQFANSGRIFFKKEDEYNLKFKRYFRFDHYLPSDQWSDLIISNLPNLNILNGIDSVNNFDPLLPKRFVEWMNKVNQISGSSLDGYFELMDVARVVSYEGDMLRSANVGQNQVSNRLRWYTCVIGAKSEDNTWELLNDIIKKGDQVRYLIVEGLKTEFNGCSGFDNSHLEINKYTSNEIEISVESISGGWLSLSQTWYPGWKAFISGRETEIYRSNYLFQAVQVPAGNYRIKFEYKPDSFKFGLGISLIGVILVITNFTLSDKLSSWRKD